MPRKKARPAARKRQAQLRHVMNQKKKLVQAIPSISAAMRSHSKRNLQMEMLAYQLLKEQSE